MDRGDLDRRSLRWSGGGRWDGWMDGLLWGVELRMAMSLFLGD